MNAHATFTPVDADPVDIHVGARVRLLRKERRISQTALADALALTFQQIQKYEQGRNRISASKLHAIAGFMDVPVAFFFEGLPGSVADGDPLGDAEILVALADPRRRLMARLSGKLNQVQLEAALAVVAVMAGDR